MAHEPRSRALGLTGRFTGGFRVIGSATAVVSLLAFVCWLPHNPKADTSGIVTTDRPETSIERSAEYDYDPPLPGTYRLPVVKPAGDGEVLTADGKSARLRDIVSGQVTILSFIYTRCADPRACPMATGALYQIHEISAKDPVLADNLRLVTFSFDPANDTPRVMTEYAGRVRPGGKGAEWLFLTTRSDEELKPILSAYGQTVDRKKNLLDPLGPFYHVLRVYLIDREGMVRNIYAYGMLDPRMVVTDVRTLLMDTTAGNDR
jgi:cytochrome oxidase Cu insertion factor (SCO1/SenC/PrrC family)